MTTKPKAKKFRIRRSQPLSMGGHPVGHPSGATAPLRAVTQPEPEAQEAPRPAAESVRRHLSAVRTDPQPQPHPTAGADVPPQPTDTPQDDPVATVAETASPRQVSGENTLDQIRREGLTGRQLRMARRVAQKHGLAPTSDFDAVRLLRAKGIDPFQRSTMLELVVPQDNAPVPSNEHMVQLPQTVEVEKRLPSTQVGVDGISPSDRRAQEISEIQRDIARRRRRKSMLLLSRLAFFVFLPTILAGWYYFTVATPMYATKSEFLILEADAVGGSALGGLLSGTQFATNQDAIAVQSYLQSRDAMQRLDSDIGFKTHFSQDWIDPIQRLEPNASDEAAYGIYKKNVQIGYDPTEGVIRMEVIAADPKISAAFSEHLISYAEKRVDDLSRRKREDQMKEARSSLEEAKQERREAQVRLVQLQEGTLLDPEGEIASIRSLMNNVELQLQEKELQLQTLLNNARPSQPRVDALRTEIRLLGEELSKQSARLTQATNGGTSLAAKAAQIQIAQADLATADLFLQSALQNEKQTAQEANRQVRYLTTSVSPVPPDDPTYPRAFENTLLAFLIFSGIYLMFSLTASILREQVST
ncbi:capsular polysaccharide transport system permease protein [Thalassovita litoralis]|jgi:capsular polysaccharide transport system permease protein|uniref:Capsular polysaccharide transport system permease protein n=1 Tax=Thalassovita litoralis TaxID=1010611 RepID=A0A521DCY7_9RHOB|nr:capsule biosynthesis protein [Thalassovita litoralis]SMO69011.1 capsular polysaccharide transport system permease protein [Thalassovita litoralis]